jgi:procollagen-lysine,2-oxoglutarate 5-dioxygenase
MSLMLLSSILLSVVVTYFFTRKYLREKYKNRYITSNSQRLNSVYYPPAANEKLHVYTVATYPDPALDQLIASCQECGFGIHVLGLSNKWQGFGNKWLWTAEYIRLQKLPDDAIVVFLDAYDVLAVAKPTEIINKFLDFKARVVFSAERGCHPDAEVSHKFPETSSSFKYLNSGGAIGYAGDLLKVIDEIDFATTDDDQRGFINYFLNNPGRIVLDYECAIFLSLFGVDEGELLVDASAGRVRLLGVDTPPCFVHGNGPSISLLNNLQKQLKVP